MLLLFLGLRLFKVGLNEGGIGNDTTFQATEEACLAYLHQLIFKVVHV